MTPVNHFRINEMRHLAYRGMPEEVSRRRKGVVELCGVRDDANSKERWSESSEAKRKEGDAVRGELISGMK